MRMDEFVAEGEPLSVERTAHRAVASPALLSRGAVEVPEEGQRLMREPCLALEPRQTALEVRETVRTDLCEVFGQHRQPVQLVPWRVVHARESEHERSQG